VADPIHIKKSHEGRLHKSLHASTSKKIPSSELESRLAAAKRSGNTKLEKELVFAENARKWHKK
jgi:hypothetical protein